MKHYAVDGHLQIHNNRTFPEADVRLLRRYNFDTCAIVRNSGSLLRSASHRLETGCSRRGAGREARLVPGPGEKD